MPTTTPIDITTSVRGIEERTDAAGDDVTDLPAESDRMAHAWYTDGALTATAWQVSAGTGMDALVGSGTAKADRYLIGGDVAGQEAYIVRLDQAPATVTLSPADLSQARIDEVYLYVADHDYDAGGLSLPRLGYRRGDPAGTPAAPGVDTGWKAAELLARLTVPAGATSIADVTFLDMRAASVPRMLTGTGGDCFTATAPWGALLRQGQAVSRTRYARLFAAIGTTFGAGDGSTTFNLPNDSNRFSVGVGSDYDLGDTGGAAAVDLTTDEMPSHGHNASTNTTGSHTHTLGFAGTPTADTNVPAGHGSGVNDTFPTSSNGSHDHTVTVAAEGGGLPHENRPPYLAANKIIWT